jgi:hypothetical protein
MAGPCEIVLRPIRPEDEAQHLAFLQRLDPVDIRMRIFYSRRSIERSELARLTQIDYEREMAFIATGSDPVRRAETLGVARALADPDNVEAEFGIIVRSDLKGGGLGERLMRKLIGTCAGAAPGAWWPPCCATTNACSSWGATSVSRSRSTPRTRRPCGWR